MGRVIAGKLCHRVKIQKRSTKTNTVGEQELVWTEVGTVWAEVQPLTGRKLESAQRLSSAVSHEIRVRYQEKFKDTRIVSTYRCFYDGRVFNVLGCLNMDEGRALISLLAEEGLSEV